MFTELDVLNIKGTLNFFILQTWLQKLLTNVLWT